MEIEVELRLLRTDHLREILPAHFITVFKFTIFICLLLNGIICQMDKLVGHIIESVLPTARANIAILVAISLETAVDAGQQAEASEVELTAVYQ